MTQFVCPTCGATLYSAAPLTKCSWCGTPAPVDPDPEPDGEREESGEGE